MNESGHKNRTSSEGNFKISPGGQQWRLDVHLALLTCGADLGPAAAAWLVWGWRLDAAWLGHQGSQVTTAH